MRRSTRASAIAAAMLVAGPAVAEDVTVPGPEGNLFGTLVMPAPDAPVVVVLPGSGPTDRDGNNPLGVAAAPYRMLAEALAERGVGTLRTDKRGQFASSGAIPDPNAVTIADYVTDARAWSALARQRSGRECVWLLGHSEGGIIALAAAQEAQGFCGLILVASPGRPIGDVLREQLAANPANAPVLEQAFGAITSLEKGVRVDVATLHPGLAPLFAPQLQGFWIDLMAQDPAGLAASARLPLLIVQGGKDLQTTIEDGEALKAARPDATYALFEDMNHVLKRVEGNDPRANAAAYANPSLPLVPGLADAIALFMETAR